MARPLPSLLHILIRLDKLLVAADVLTAILDFVHQKVIERLDDRHGGDFRKREIARGEQRLVVHGAQHVRCLAGERRLLITGDHDHAGASVFSCLGNAHQALGASGVGDYKQDVFGLHGEGKAHGDLAYLVRSAAQSQLRKLERGIERHGVSVAHGDNLDNASAGQALYHRANRRPIEATQRGFEFAYFGGEDAS